MIDYMLFEVVEEIINDKKAAGKAPAHALILADIVKPGKYVREDVEREIRRLEAAGMVKTGDTINDRYVTIVTNVNV